MRKIKKILVDITTYTDELTTSEIVGQIAKKLEDAPPFSTVDFILTDRDGAADVFVTVKEQEV
ncbi:hypothetical protein BH772_gp042 [Gordonia phage Bachita]|uniref:Uncharacterized protein n=1 Tax=Gordonia phage Bachita TaxID=1838061 RepID=A0A166YBY3_9CAUD|nr:hypothetical protein BH772_gp042 [Gordonia phage Bachita]ANA86843.1 hypothetical protein PBI_BACHITA_169 [Gordonia phage Bachita]